MTSAARSKKSKKQSASNSTSKPPEEPLVFFVDECLGIYKVPNALRAAGAVVETLTAVFTQGIKDPEWLAEMAAHRDWIVLTKDKNIRRHRLEVEALSTAMLRVFVITATDLTGEEAGAVVVEAFPKIRRFCAKHDAPFIAGITRMSDVTLILGRRRHGKD